MRANSRLIMKRDNAIYLTTRIYPNTNGGTQHNIGTCRYLQRYLNVTMVSLLDPKYSIEDAQVETDRYALDAVFEYACAKSGIIDKFCLLEPVDSNVLATIYSVIETKSVSWIFYTLKILPYVEKIRKHYPKLKYIYISHNAEFMNIKNDIIQYDNINNVHKLRHMIKLVQAKAYILREREAIKVSDKIFSISNSDSVYLSKRYRDDIDKFVLNKPMIAYSTKRNKNKWTDENYSHSILIVGNMNWYPTVKGIIRFIENVYYKLRETDTSLQLYIVGANPAQELYKKADIDSSIIITGYVESVNDYYEKCDIAVVPIYEGTGAKLKVLEAVGNRIPVVLTQYAAKDYEGIEKAASVAKDDASLTELVLELMNSAIKRKRLIEQEQKYYVEYMKVNKYVDRFFEGCKTNSATEQA